MSPAPTVWHSLSYQDAPAAVDFLTEAFGFVAKGVYRDEENPDVVVHAQLDWPPGGGVSDRVAWPPRNSRGNTVLKVSLTCV